VGSIGGVGARMHLIGGGSVAKGEFYRQNDWIPVIVGGRIQADGALLLHDEQDSKCVIKDECTGSGVLRARLKKVGLTGTWKAEPGEQPEAMRMRQEPAPKCDAVGPKHIFSDPTWPIAFEYPAAWHVDSGAHAISLLCPDPDWMAYMSFNVSLTLGSQPQGSELANEAEFTRDAAGKWQYQSYLGGDPEPALIEQRDGLTIIRAEDASDRGYCVVGGYSGLEDEEVVLIILGNRWILIRGGPQSTEIVNLLVKSAALRK